MRPDNTVMELLDLKASKGFGSVCVTDTGKLGGKLLGVVSSRDYDFVTDLHTPLSELMTTDVETVQEGLFVFLIFFDVECIIVFSH